MVYVVGDIHGYLDQLDRALSLIEHDGGRDAEVVFVGDYTDRGPNSRGVIERLMDGRDAGRNWTFLKGNHDRMFQWFMEEQPRQDPHLSGGLTWQHKRLGGLATLASYGVEAEGWFRLKSLHAQARKKVPASHIEFLTHNPLFVETDAPHPKLIVHGHTAVDYPEHRGNRVNLDGGTGYGRDLWPARFDGTNCTLLTINGERPLSPS